MDDVRPPRPVARVPAGRSSHEQPPTATPTGPANPDPSKARTNPLTPHPNGATA